MQCHLRPLAKRPKKAVDLTTGQLLALLTNLLSVVTPAFLAKEGVGQSGG